MDEARSVAAMSNGFNADDARSVVSLSSALEADDTTPPSAMIDAVDDRVDAWFDQLRGNPAFDRLFYAASELGDHSRLWHLLATGKAAASLRAEPAALRVVLALAVESGLVNGVVKSMFNRSRPIITEQRPLRLRIPRTSSFPSGHASSATMAAILLADRSRFGPLYGAAAAIVAVSRIHVRIHHASDVAGGVAMGALLAAAVKKLAPLR